mmetsp:Transcript_122549/g.347442  ORF Transcript_122549/g.347442 Transcript_122549/m.347442 type:complete len:212 (+) Transcript_122549:25-660(+)
MEAEGAPPAGLLPDTGAKVNVEEDDLKELMRLQQKNVDLKGELDEINRKIHQLRKATQNGKMTNAAAASLRQSMGMVAPAQDQKPPPEYFQMKKELREKQEAEAAAAPPNTPSRPRSCSSLRSSSRPHSNAPLSTAGSMALDERRTPSAASAPRERRHSAGQGMSRSQSEGAPSAPGTPAGAGGRTGTAQLAVSGKLGWRAKGQRGPSATH